MSFKAVIVPAIIFLYGTLTYSQTTIFVKYKDSVSRTAIDAKISSGRFFSSSPVTALQKTNFKAGYFADNLGRDDEELSRIVKINFTDSQAAHNFILQAQKDPSIQYAQASNIYKIDSVPNDSLDAQQWALKKIEAYKAWDITEGADSILIGVIDTGIDYLHPDLKNQIYRNPGENGRDTQGRDKSSNGIDDDGNGFIDDYMGWDFTDRKGFPFDTTGGDYLGWDNNPMDENGHGTDIAGIIAAETNNIIGIAGAAPKVKLLNCRAFDPSGYGEEDDVAAAILYAVKMGAKVINMSFGDSKFSYVLRDVIRYAYNKGVVLVASSGNSGNDQPHYPSGYSEVICVGNSTNQDYVSEFSNYGSTLDLVAPGTDILTTALGGGYTSVTGTSASAPFVSAAAGLILSLGNFTNDEVRQILKSTADDIEAPGWDLNSGAGRLNMYRALSVLAPSVIKFDSPKQDYSTASDTLSVYATILSSYFKSYSLYVGTGLNPDSWTALISNGQYQFSDKNIYNLNLSSYKDTVYCLRLVVNVSSGNAMEERENFYVMRKPPSADLVTVGPAFYGNRTTVLAAVYTNQPSTVRMYYRKAGSPSFKFVTLDGFSTNTESVTYLHYGFIPTDLVEQNSDYEVYFEAENLAGLKTVVNNGGADFVFKTDFPAEIANETEEPFSLPPGEIYKNPINLTTTDSTEVVLRPYSNSAVSYVYRLSGNQFTVSDSLNQKIVKDFGDFNNNGKKDLLTYFVYQGYIEEQSSPLSPVLEQKFASTESKFWPIMAGDIYGNGKTEILEMNSDTSIAVWNVGEDLSLSDSVQLPNFTPGGTYNNLLDAPHAVVADMYGDGKKEIWMLDDDGDIYDYKIIGPGNFQKDRVIATGFPASTEYLAAGDFTGDGRTDMAVLLHSDPAQDVAPFNRLLVFNLMGDSVNVIYDRAFIDPSTEFNSQFQQAENGIRFADIDNSGKDDLILFAFPYSYIFRYGGGTVKIISYKENINSSSIFVGDLNRNGVPDVAFPTAQGIKFYEFSSALKSSVPFNLTGCSIDSSSVYLSWEGSGSKFYIYRGSSAAAVSLIDSTVSNYYTDRQVSSGKYYYYSVKAYDGAKQQPLSDLSQPVKIYAHSPAAVLSAESLTPLTVNVSFSGLMNNTIEDLHNFQVIGEGYPNSVSASGQFSYLITMSAGMSPGKHQLIVSGLTDYYGSPVAADTVGFDVKSAPQQIEFYAVSHEILNPYLVKVDFNLVVDQQSASDPGNYTLTPSIGISSVTFDSKDPKAVFLHLDGTRPVGAVGEEYTLHIQNLRSSSADGSVPINTGAGSYILLSAFAKNLSGVYVYPSPARLNNGEGKITFAGLPQRAKITIFDLNGKKIYELREENGDGGTEYNLRDFNGNLLNSGIYVYRIVRLDDSNNEVEEKLGKFAVIR